MAMIRYTDEPGTPAWHARRARCFNAGDASAMLGCHPSGYTRTQLLQDLHTGIEREFSDFVQERVIDPGHRVEALWRPAMAEPIIGEDLQVLAGTLDVGLSRPLGASLDGITFMEDTLGECKSANEALRAALPHTGRDSHERNDARQLPKGYRVQLEQQQLVTGASRTLFSACQFNADGSVAEERHCWYTSDPALRAEILAGWRQFDADLAAYVPTEVKEMPKAEVTLALPALFIHAKGEITTSNMKEYGEALAKRLADVRAIALVTDQDFSNAKESAKLLRENILQARAAKAGMLAQTVTVGEAANMIDAWCEDMRLTALKLEQDVEREDRVKKAAMIAKAKGDYEQHIAALTKETGGPWIVLPVPDWAGAIKNKRSYASMQDSLDTALANGKIAAAESARKIRAALAALDDEAKGHEHLFADRLSFISKPADDVRALVKGRIAEHRAAEERRAAELAERERERIRREEAERMEREAREAQERLQREQAERRARGELEYAEALGAEKAGTALECRRTPHDTWRCRHPGEEMSPHMYYRLAPAQAPATPAPTQPPVAAPITPLAVSSQAANVVPMGTRAPDTGARLKLGEINARLAPIALTADGLAALGFQPVATEKAAKLYAAADLPRMCAALIALLSKVSGQQRAA